MKKTKIGSVGVDSGQLMITDPCYVKDFDLHNDFEDIRRYKNKKSGKVLQYQKDFSNYEEIIPEYKKTMNELNSNGEWIELPHPHSKDRSYSVRGSCMATIESDGGELGNSSGVVFSSGFGDGCYDVYAYTQNIEGWGNRVCKVEIVLIDPEDRN